MPTKPIKKKKISTASCKDKGRRLQKWIEQQISSVTGIPCGKDQCIQSREMGQRGVDIKLIGQALKKYPFSIEAKNQEAWSLSVFIKQAKDNQLPNTDWQLFLKKNRHEEIVIMDAAVWFEIWREMILLKSQLKRKRRQP
jgi:Zn ribbon nucleic-acid-binding protein